MIDETCGNSVVDPGETCDDGDNQSGDGCSARCVAEFCGNNVVDVNEVCDDGDNDDGDGCSANCTSDETCGNGILDAGEVCDDNNNNNNNDGCSSTCLLEAGGGGCNGIGVCVISVTPDMMLSAPYACGNSPTEYADCTNYVGNGFSWTDTTGVAPTSISVTVFPFWTCNPAGTRDVVHNGVDVGDYDTGGGCVCTPGSTEREIVFDSVANFVVGGVNTISLPYPVGSTNCDAMGPDPSTTSATYGHVRLTY